MKKLSLPLAIMTAVAATAFTSSAMAKKWDFNAWSGDTALDWKKETRTTGGGGDQFLIGFKGNKVKFIGGKLVLVSDNWDDSKSTNYGGGIYTKDGKWTTQAFAAKCDMKRPDGTTSANVNNATHREELRRSQAAFWLDKQNGSLDTFEVDMFEMKPNPGVMLNFISWRENPDGSGNVNTGKFSKANPSHPMSAEFKKENRNEQWDDGGDNYKYKLNGLYRMKYETVSGGKTKFTVKRGGATPQGLNDFEPGHNMEGRGVLTTLTPRVIKKTIKIENKPWRLNAAPSNGPTAALACDYARDTF